ncbi:MAG: carbohydrate-binding family 9-like protein [Polyangiaceae bacterium]
MKNVDVELSHHGVRAMSVSKSVVGVVGAVLALGFATGCVGGSKGLSSEDKDKVKPFILDTAPSDIAHKLDVNFENKIHLIGYKFEPETAKPGSELKITCYWRVDEPLDEGWLLFTHLHDDVVNKSDNLDWGGPLREERKGKQLFGPEKWEKGKVYVDQTTYKVPDWVKGPELTVMTGIWKGDSRLRIVTGPNDGDNRAIVGRFKTGLTAPQPEEHSGVPEVTSNKLAANEKIVIDGKGDDKGWGAAASIGPFVDVGTGKPNPGIPTQGNAKITWDDQNLYVLVDVQSTDVVGHFTTPDAQKGDWTTTKQPKLWTKDTVEVMIDPDGDGDNKDYYEIQINPQNKIFKSQFDALQTPQPTTPDGAFGHEDWDAKIKSAVVVRGTMDKPGDKDEGYTVEAAIPWASLSKAKNHPPKNGDAWRMNFYAMKNNGGTAWSPILGQGNFHKASRFGKVVWAIPGAPPPAPTGSANAASPAPSGSASAAPHAAGTAGAAPAPKAVASAAVTVKAPGKIAKP